MFWGWSEPTGMKISEKRDTPPVGSVSGTRRADSSGAGENSATLSRSTRSVAEVATFLGIPQGELTPNVRAGLARLLEEVDRLRQLATDRERRVAYLEQLADEDPLTPLLNRRAFVRELSRMIAFADRYGSPASVIYFDINGMKAINDTHGHAAGDAVLNHVADVLLHHSRTSDAVGRLGGDEFAVILAQADQQIADAKAADLSQRIAEAPLIWEGHEIKIQSAFGAFAFGRTDDAEAVLSAADRAMYQCKQEMAGKS